mmetsp:Transcript_29212/g.41351  ORF Transcript_29212/g.41351 Transcript_29212/m.41351 type:complete len:87 (-) Transcript_29212:83-343(-)
MSKTRTDDILDVLWLISNEMPNVDDTARTLECMLGSNEGADVVGASVEREGERDGAAVVKFRTVNAEVKFCKTELSEPFSISELTA